ncbi:MAG TPA: Asp-tRNA(Asn)/Glu-tRNA(Gln) amidotransferase GatCAB subunit B, partial [Thermodesulfobacteriaceae bacterium]|nr:Asp-tRNA(Asn)/Glu-tRNA(Gln) amidotransferase GatCAB subunit B [Thermodesulfobacteriaceae bacterium]
SKGRDLFYDLSHESLADIPKSWNYFIRIEPHGLQHMLSGNQSSHIHFGDHAGKVQVISGTTAKEVLRDAYSSGISPGKIVKEKGLIQVSDESTLSTVIEKVLKDHPAEVEKYRSGTRKVLGFLMGRVMKETQGRANPKKVNAMLLKALE